MIKRFKNQIAEKLFQGEAAPELEDVKSIALRALDILQAASQLHDIQAPFGERLALGGDTISERRDLPLNDRWRLRFVWTSTGPDEVELLDWRELQGARL